ncbi:MAG: hypothetical protein HBSAPP03_21660 [Phycisphaerae bacterium]|nr:MAG: hypothetical protein HBSAPP03_21660 [Phycisphaerae bacterium]
MLRTAAWTAFVDSVAASARQAGVFGEVTIRDGMLEAAASGSGSPAYYRVSHESGRVWVSLVMADRYLSQSIEQDLVHTGDKLADLLEEELVDLDYPKLGHASPTLAVEHFRDEGKLFTFRSVLPIDASQLADARSRETARIVLLAYEAMFRRLGDMEAGTE